MRGWVCDYCSRFTSGISKEITVTGPTSTNLAMYTSFQFCSWDCAIKASEKYRVVEVESEEYKKRVMGDIQKVEDLKSSVGR